MKKLANLKWIVVAAVVISIAGLTIFWRNNQNNEAATSSEAEVTRGDVDISILATGSVLPENRLEIKAPVPGRMEKVLVSEGQRLHKGQIIAWMSSSERAALLDAARAKGEAEYNRWSDLYMPTPIMAPIAGTLILRNVEPGQTFTSMDPIFVMSDRLTIKAQVDETDMSKIRLKAGAEIILDAYPEQIIEAEVDQIAFDAKVINSVTTYIIDVLPIKPPSFMRSGMTANITFFIESRKNILTVPNEALKVQDGKTGVYLKGADGGALWRELKPGISDGKKTEVLSGLKEGDKILISEVKLGLENKKKSNPFSPFGGGHAPRR